MSDRVDSQSAAPRDSFGCQVSHLSTDRHIAAAGINFHLKHVDGEADGQLMMPASNRGYLVGLSLVRGHRRRILEPRRAATYEFSADDIYIRNLSDAFKADVSGSFSFVLCEISPAALGRIADGADARGVGELSRPVASRDPLLGGLLRTLFVAATDDGVAGTLLVDQLAVAIGTHLVDHYGNGPPPDRSGRRARLAPDMERRVKSFMDSHLCTAVTVDDLAGVCGLSRRAFVAGFLGSTGMMPHQWLAQRRIDHAMALMLSTRRGLGDIAADCGFSSQSQFSRAFSAAMGATPTAWRRQRLD